FKRPSLTFAKDHDRDATVWILSIASCAELDLIVQISLAKNAGSNLLLAQSPVHSPFNEINPLIGVRLNPKELAYYIPVAMYLLPTSTCPRDLRDQNAISEIWRWLLCAHGFGCSLHNFGFNYNQPTVSPTAVNNDISCGPSKNLFVYCANI